MQVFSKIVDLAYYLPEEILSNDSLASFFPGWTSEKIYIKTGIRNRRVAGLNETSGDMAFKAALNLFAKGKVKVADIDFIILCTQTPDYLLPTTACIIQDKLGVSKESGALDINLGCSGYVYGLSLAQGLIESRNANNVLLLTADTYSKYIHPLDKSVRTLFGDAATATVISGASSSKNAIGPFVFGTDGKGSDNLIIKSGGARQAKNADTSLERTDNSGNIRSLDNLFMNGSEVMTFTLQEVPKILKKLLIKTGLSDSAIDYYVLHQANRFLLEALRKKMNIDTEKLPISIEETGNTVSSSIPLLLIHMMENNCFNSDKKIILIGFGVGYSWGACVVNFNGAI